MISLYQRLLLLLAKSLSLISRRFNFGAGSTWPGEFILRFDEKLAFNLFKQLDCLVIISGTNGKTTTAKILRTIIGKNKLICNSDGANLLNGLITSLIKKTDLDGRLKKRQAVFEVDENSLIEVLKITKPKVLVLLNLFRDQLDRYGEVNIIASNWRRTLTKLDKKTTLILNADDPLITNLGIRLKCKMSYFALERDEWLKKIPEHTRDIVYCPICNRELVYQGFYWSHCGQWQCQHCRFKQPESDVDSSQWQSLLPGRYNQANTLAAVLTAKVLGISSRRIKKKLQLVTPAFGRLEKIKIKDKFCQILLSKNPTGFNQSINLLSDLKPPPSTVLLVLNDNIADGRDVSWIWDVDMEPLVKNDYEIIVSGQRAEDMALRIKYQISNIKNQKFILNIKNNLTEAIQFGLNNIKKNENLYILPTYTAMLATRKILLGRKI